MFAALRNHVPGQFIPAKRTIFSEKSHTFNQNHQGYTALMFAALRIHVTSLLISAKRSMFSEKSYVFNQNNPMFYEKLPVIYEQNPGF